MQGYFNITCPSVTSYCPLSFGIWPFFVLQQKITETRENGRVEQEAVFLMVSSCTRGNIFVLLCVSSEVSYMKLF